MTNATAGKTFDGGGFTYADLTFDGSGSGVLTVTGANAFRNFTAGAGRTVSFAASTTTVVADLTATGTSLSGITLQSSTPGTRFTLSSPSGRRKNIDYVSIKDCLMTGGAFWFVGAHSTNSGNNNGQKYLPASARCGIAGVLAV
jgi:hypothetical protein